MTAWESLVEFARSYLDPDAEPLDDPYGMLESVATWVVKLDDEAARAGWTPVGSPTGRLRTSRPVLQSVPPPVDLTTRGAVRVVAGKHEGRIGVIVWQQASTDLFLVSFDDVDATAPGAYSVRTAWLVRDEFELVQQ